MFGKSDRVAPPIRLVQSFLQFYKTSINQDKLQRFLQSHVFTEATGWQVIPQNTLNRTSKPPFHSLHRSLLRHKIGNGFNGELYSSRVLTLRNQKNNEVHKSAAMWHKRWGRCATLRSTVNSACGWTAPFENVHAFFTVPKTSMIITFVTN